MSKEATRPSARGRKTTAGPKPRTIRRNAVPPRPAAPTGKGAVRRKRRRRGSSNWLRKLSRAPHALKWLMVIAAIIGLWAAINGLYQVARKPSELLFPIGGVLNKVPADTWRSYQAVFRRFSTALIPAELLAALAQAEASGNPVARTYWRWSWSLHPFELYRPASSSVGLYQMTDGAFAEAKRLCIREHVVLSLDGPQTARQPCEYNDLYTRLLPSDAVELTAAFLDRQVMSALQRHGRSGASRLQKQHLAATIHLCGAGVADLYVRRGFRFAAGERCGAHDPAAYLVKVDALETQFTRLAAYP